MVDLTNEQRRGLDEVRRLLYIWREAATDGVDPSHELVGTVINALKHHHPEVGVGFQTDERGDVGWTNAGIEAITALLGDGDG